MTSGIIRALKRHGDKLLAEEKARGILPAERKLLDQLNERN